MSSHKQKEHYSNVELDAYKVPFKARYKCTDEFVPFKICAKNLGWFSRLQDPKKGKCSNELHNYEHCINNMIHHEKLKHISDSYYANPKQAAKDGISPLFEQENYRSPLAFTWL